MCKLSLTAVLLAALLAWIPVASALDASPGDSPAPIAEGVAEEPSEETAPDAATEPNKATGESVSAGDLVKELAETKAALDAYRQSEDPQAKKLLLFGFLLIVTNLLITGIKKWRKLTSKGKKWLPWVALGLGVVAGGLTMLAGGRGWVDALWYGMGPPGAVLLHELLKRREA